LELTRDGFWRGRVTKKGQMGENNSRGRNKLYDAKAQQRCVKLSTKKPPNNRQKLKKPQNAKTNDGNGGGNKKKKKKHEGPEKKFYPKGPSPKNGKVKSDVR